MKPSFATPTRAPHRTPHGARRLALLMAAALALPVHAAPPDAGHWVGTWGAGAGGPPLPGHGQTFSKLSVIGGGLN